MSVRSTVGGLLASACVLAVAGWAGATVLPTLASPPTPPAPASGATGTPPGSGSASPSAGRAADGNYTGDSVATPFGDVQVQVQIKGGRIAEVAAMHLTDHDRHSVSISNRAAPVLRQEVLDAQSSAVSMVSGATFTSEAYLGSLQSALDQAGF